MEAVMIVGAGAVGTVLAYNFVKHGIPEGQVCLFVREKYKSALLEEKPLTLYSLEDQKVHRLFCHRMNILSHVEEVKSLNVDIKIIINTLPANVVLSNEGQKLISLIDMATNRQCIFLGLQPALDAFSLYTACGIEEKRIAIGAFLLLSYPSNSPSIPTPSASKDTVYTYKFLQRENTPIMISSLSKTAIEQVQHFLGVYKLKSRIISYKTFSVIGNLAFPLFAGLEVQDWRPLGIFNRNTALAAGCMREIAYYHDRKDGNISGFILSWMIGPGFVLVLQWILKLSHYPIDFFKFSQYHHGIKVLSQDHMIIKDYIHEGEKLGLNMKKSRSLFRLVE